MIKSILGVPMLAALLLAGCGGGGGGSTNGSAATNSTPPVVFVAPAGTVATTALSATNLLFPEGLAVSPDGHTLYVANASDDSITEIDLTSSNYASRTLPLVQSGSTSTPYQLQAPAGLAVSPDGRTLYVANFGISPNNGFITEVALNSCTTSCPTSTLPYTASPAIDNPTGLAVSSTSLFVANHGGQNVMQLTLGTSATLAASYSNGATPINPWDVLLNPSGLLYVTDNEAGTVTSLDASSGTLDPTSHHLVASGPRASTGMTMIGSYLYVASYQNKAIYKVDPASGASVATLDVAPHQPFFLGTDGMHLFFTDGNDGSVDEIVQP